MPAGYGTSTKFGVSNAADPKRFASQTSQGCR
jgi:hypothetical protein